MLKALTSKVLGEKEVVIEKADPLANLYKTPEEFLQSIT